MTNIDISRPQAHAAASGNRAVLTLPDGTEEIITFSYGEDVRNQLVSLTIAEAQSLGEPIELVTVGQNLGEMRLAVHPDGRVLPALSEDAWAPPGLQLDEEPAPADIKTESDLAIVIDEPDDIEDLDIPTGDVPVQDEDVVEEDITPPAPVVDDAVFEAARRARRSTGAKAEATSEQPPAPAELPLRRRRQSFIDTREPLRAEPTAGWRRALSTVGIKVGASKKDLDNERARRTVSAQWGQCRRIAVVNGKGGVGKTSATALLSAVFGREGGGGVLAWDNNPTRGSLGWRTESAGHDATVQDLLNEAERLLDPNAPRALIADFVHHQTDDRYDVLRSNPQLLATRQQIGADEFDLLSRVIDRSYRLTVFDSGNDESASWWLRMIDWSHQLVVPTLPSPESAESAMLLLQELTERDEHSRQLAENAVVVLMCNEPNPGRDLAAIREGFVDVGVKVLEIPFDKAMKSGPLRFGTLAPATREAWLNVAAAAAEGFTRAV